MQKLSQFVVGMSDSETAYLRLCGDFVWQTWDSEVVIYNISSGDTFVLPICLESFFVKCSKQSILSYAECLKLVEDSCCGWESGVVASDMLDNLIKNELVEVVRSCC